MTLVLLRQCNNAAKARETYHAGMTPLHLASARGHVEVRRTQDRMEGVGVRAVGS